MLHHDNTQDYRKVYKDSMATANIVACKRLYRGNNEESGRSRLHQLPAQEDEREVILQEKSV
jgi:hypothetical protein